MDEYNSPNIDPNLNDQQFRLNKIIEVRDYFIGEIQDRELMSKRLSKYIVSFNYFDNCYWSSCRNSKCKFQSCIFNFHRNSKKSLKDNRNKKKKHNKIFILTRSKLNTVKSKISEALINSEISHEDFITIINEEKSYHELKESIRMMKTQRSDTEKNYLIEEGKKKGTDEAIKRNEFVNNSLKSEI